MMNIIQRDIGILLKSIHDLNLDLAKFNGEIYFFEMSYVDVFEKIKSNFQIEQIVSYQEIGLKNSWKCDKSLKNGVITQIYNGLNYPIVG